MSLFGDLVKGALGGFPEKPSVPDAPKLTDAQQSAIQANLNALPGSQELASKVNQFNMDELDKMLRFAIPNYDQLTSKSESNIFSLLHGEIPQDVQDRLQTSDAVKALTGGYGGSGMHGNLVARDLGLTSLDLTQRGLTAAESWIDEMARLHEPGRMDVRSMFVSPTQVYGSDLNAWNVKWLKNQLKAMPDPEQAAIASDVGAITDSFASALSSYLGGMGGVGGALGGAIGLGAGGGSSSATNMMNGVYHTDPNTGAGVWLNSQPYSSGGG